MSEPISAAELAEIEHEGSEGRSSWTYTKRLIAEIRRLQTELVAMATKNERQSQGISGLIEETRRLENELAEALADKKELERLIGILGKQ